MDSWMTNPLFLAKLAQYFFTNCIISVQFFATFSLFGLAMEIRSLSKLKLTKNQDWNFWSGMDHGEEVHDQQHQGTKSLQKNGMEP